MPFKEFLVLFVVMFAVFCIDGVVLLLLLEWLEVGFIQRDFQKIVVVGVIICFVAALLLANEFRIASEIDQFLKF